MYYPYSADQQAFDPVVTKHKLRYTRLRRYNDGNLFVL